MLPVLERAWQTLELTKHHGLGNDFLVVFHPHVDDLPALARRLCDRRRGIGADGLLVGESDDGYAARMVLYNADGSRAEMSGNGIRCFAQALAAPARRPRSAADPHRRRRAPGHDLRRPRAPTCIEAAVDMGEVATIDEPADWHRIGTDPLRPVSHLSVGNPHTVVGVDDVASSTCCASARSCRTSTSRSSSRAGAARDHDARPRTWRRHHRGVRHRCLRQCVGGARVGPRRRRPSKKSSCTWTVEMPRYVCTNRHAGHGHPGRSGECSSRSITVRDLNGQVQQGKRMIDAVQRSTRRNAHRAHQARADRDRGRHPARAPPTTTPRPASTSWRC